MSAAQHSRIEDLDASSAANAIETFARAVRDASGVWAVTVRECRFGSHSLDLHLIVHADGDDAELFGAREWWSC